MYTVYPTKTFKKSYRKYWRSGRLSKTADAKLARAVTLLSESKNLPKEFSDHALKGPFQGYRECHIGGDVLLVYLRDSENCTVTLIDIGTHAELFG